MKLYILSKNKMYLTKIKRSIAAMIASINFFIKLVGLGLELLYDIDSPFINKAFQVVIFVLYSPSCESALRLCQPDCRKPI